MKRSRIRRKLTSPDVALEELAVRTAVFDRDRGCLVGTRVPSWGSCFGVPSTFHHLRKASQGGAYTVDNGVELCSYHNDQVEDHPDKARVLGLSVSKGVDHEEAARRRAHHGLVPYPRRFTSHGQM